MNLKMKRAGTRVFVQTIFLCCMGVGLLGLGLGHAEAQGVRVSPTPVSAVLPQAQPQAVQQEAVFSSPTPSPTSTEDPVVSLSVKPDLGSADVRGLPDPEGEKLDPITVGAKYPIMGRFYKWLQFKYDKSLTGYGWVFEDLVDITGSGPIPDANPYITPSPTPLDANAQETRAAATLTPGAIETLDAQDRMITLPEMAPTEEAGEAVVLPTFTMPAEVAPRTSGSVAQIDDQTGIEETLVRAASGQIPPLVPILLLAGAGLLGLIVSVLRR